MTLPAVKREVELHEWLMTIDGIGHRTKNGVIEYFHVDARPKLTASATKRKTSSPIDNQLTPKRQLCLPPMPETLRKTPQGENNKSLSKIPMPQTQSSAKSRLATTRVTRSISFTPELEDKRQQTRPSMFSRVNRQQTPRPTKFDLSRITSTAIRNKQPRATDDFPRKKVRNLVQV